MASEGTPTKKLLAETRRLLDEVSSEETTAGEPGKLIALSGLMMITWLTPHRQNQRYRRYRDTVHLQVPQMR